MDTYASNRRIEIRNKYEIQNPNGQNEILHFAQNDSFLRRRFGEG